MFKKKFIDLGNGRLGFEFIKENQVLDARKGMREEDWESNVIDYNGLTFQVDEHSLHRITQSIIALTTINQDIEKWSPFFTEGNKPFRINNNQFEFQWFDIDNKGHFLTIDDFKSIQALGVAKFGDTFIKFYNG
jgi:hypothetical protein